jgi:hypothetical protein
MTNQLLNSDHFSIIMNIPQNTIISRPPIVTTTTTNPRIPNIILKEQLQTIQIIFMTKISNIITQLTQELWQEHLINLEEWTQITKEMDDLISRLVNTIIKVCVKPPPPPLTTRTK